MLTAPFYLYDPSGFSPLHTRRILSGVNEGAAVYPYIIAGMVMLAGALLSFFRKDHAQGTMAQNMCIVQMVLIFIGWLSVSIHANSWVAGYPHYGMLFLFFGAFGFGTQFLSLRVGRDAIL